jgi:hypothetical protein
LAFGALPQSRSFSAPTFLPSLGHPYLGLNTLQEEKKKAKPLAIRRKRMCFINTIYIQERNFFSQIA